MKTKGASSKAIKSDRVFTVDCDDTLVMWDKSAYQEAFPLMVDIPTDYSETVSLAINERNIKTVEKFAKLGYVIIVWSRSGWEWAEKVGKAVGIDQYVTHYMAKPIFYLDDKDVETWMTERVWKAPHWVNPYSVDEEY